MRLILTQIHPVFPSHQIHFLPEMVPVMAMMPRAAPQSPTLHLATAFSVAGLHTLHLFSSSCVDSQPAAWAQAGQPPLHRVDSSCSFSRWHMDALPLAGCPPLFHAGTLVLQAPSLKQAIFISTQSRHAYGWVVTTTASAAHQTYVPFQTSILRASISFRPGSIAASYWCHADYKGLVVRRYSASSLLRCGPRMTILLNFLRHTCNLWALN